MNCLIEFIDKHLSLIKQNSSDAYSMEPRYPQFVLDHNDRDDDNAYFVGLEDYPEFVREDYYHSIYN